MNQAWLMALLIEATKADWKRRNEIHVLLSNLVADTEDDRGDGIGLVLDSLWVSTVKHNPALLPTLFPAFAIMCGDKDGTIVADINWAVYDEHFASQVK